MGTNLFELFLLACFIISMVHAQHPKSFAQWKSQNSKNYADKTEELYRTYIYTKNLEQVNLHNSDPLNTHVEAVNQFSDLTLQQFSNIYLTALPPPNDSLIIGQEKQSQDPQHHKIRVTAIDHTVRYPEAVMVRDQGLCGACYAFSSTTQIKYQYYRATGKLVTFSPQELVDCSEQFGNNGCSGGWLSYAYAYMVFNNIASQQDYPYTASKQSCKSSANPRGPSRVVSRWMTDPGCKAMLDQLQKTTIAAALWASSPAFMHYKSGVISAAACNAPENAVNHGILVVGNDQAGNMKIQNSWGIAYGQKGFVWVGANNACNICLKGGFYGSF